MHGIRLVTVRHRAAFLVRREHPAVRALALVGLVVLWELFTRLGWVPALFLPSPLSVVAELGDMARSGQLFIHVAASLERLIAGFAIGATAGVAVGVLVGQAVGRHLRFERPEDGTQAAAVADHRPTEATFLSSLDTALAGGRRAGAGQTSGPKPN